MKSKKFKIIGAIVAVFIVFIAGVVYYASTKLNPEEIRKIAITQTEKVFPKAKASLDTINISWGLNFKIELHKFAINTTSPEGAPVEMMAVDTMVVKVPLWAIITNGGVIEIQLDKPLMNYAEFPVGNNWTYAMGDKKDEDKKDEKTPEEKAAAQEKAIGIFGKSKINVKLSDVAVKYSLRDNSNGQITVSRFLVKGLNFESSTAFEIASDAKFVMADRSEVSFSTIAIGEINIADLVKNGSVSSLVIVKVNNITKTGLEWKFPEITTNVNLLLTKDGEISGKVATSFESQNKISADFKMTKQIEISNINVDIILKDIGLIMGLDRAIDLSKAKLSAKGGLIYTEDKKIDADLSFSIAPGIGYSKDGVVATTSVEGSFKQKDIYVRVKMDVLSGLVDTIVNGEYDPNQKFDMKALKPFNVKVTATRLRIPEKVIQQKLWAKKDPAVVAKEEADAEAAREKAAKEGKPMPGLPAANVNMTWSNISVGGEDFSGSGKIIVSSHAIAVDAMKFKFSKGTGTLTQTMKLGLKSNESVFDLGIKDLNLSSFKPFLPPFIDNFTGTFSGKVNGSATLFKAVKPPKYDVNVALDAKNGDIKKLNIGEFINPLLASIPMIKDQVGDKQLKLDGNFETLNMKGRFTDTTYNLASFNFIGLNKKVEITGSGTIYPVVGAPNNSSMDVYFTENAKIGELLQKNVGVKVLPIRLSGPNYAMKPEIQYTLSRIAKGAIKTKGVEAAQKVIDKNIDKIVPEKAREQVKGLLNGLFKKK
ncbi:hypothetical protein SHI21_00155 [Bacteriovorax sp. PP10]|uniref:AsmA-like C-terminal domain-containing protein n=1 Tax=Bacteriovorax antarcticus TaxID=3088717 RepID=A0ABU5VQ99_9BACT|nr:hypothetical protein [Bacteriovorax sp. PP10]MEA9354593.1 hypothetical protein [Bacteriovorax sp. PP10]